MSATGYRIKLVMGNELKVGDTMLFLNCPKLITSFKPYSGTLDFIERVAIWNNTNNGISIEADRYYKILD